MVAEFDGRRATYPFEQLDQLELAYAVTVHKSQGSEFQAVVMPLLGGFPKLYYRNLLYTAVTRQNVTGQGKQRFLPGQAMTMEQALKCYTIEGAYASGEEDQKGTITPGKLADFIVLDRDLFQIDPEEILQTKVLQTWVQGQLCYTVAP